jgi:hypothetical protein
MLPFFDDVNEPADDATPRSWPWSWPWSARGAQAKQSEGTPPTLVGPVRAGKLGIVFPLFRRAGGETTGGAVKPAIRDDVHARFPRVVERAIAKARTEAKPSP